MAHDQALDGRSAAAARELRVIARSGLRQERPDRQRALLARSPVLAALPALQAAGADPVVRFEYLARAIVDAVERLTPVPDMAENEQRFTVRLHNGELAAIALRTLFGLTHETRYASWRFRQERAAALYHVSWDRFRHDRQDDLLHRVVRELLRPGPAAPVTASPWGRSGSAEVKVYSTQREIEDQTIEYIRGLGPQTAYLLELSTSTIQPILHALREAGTLIRILVGDPRNAAASWQRRRIAETMQDLAEEFAGYEHIRVKFYTTPPSIRGRIIGDYVAAGWYSYRDDARADESDPELLKVWGHDNALVVGSATTPGGGLLADWLGREFRRMWTHRFTRYDDELFPRL